MDDETKTRAPIERTRGVVDRLAQSLCAVGVPTEQIAAAMAMSLARCARDCEKTREEFMELMAAAWNDVAAATEAP